MRYDSEYDELNDRLEAFIKAIWMLGIMPDGFFVWERVMELIYETHLRSLVKR